MKHQESHRKAVLPLCTAIPSTPQGWIVEIACAYRDAHETIPFGVYVDTRITEDELFHMTPAICLKMRGIKRTKAKLKRATEAMLSSYVATQDQTEGFFTGPHFSFAFCYIASHFGMDIMTDEEITEVLDYLEAHQDELSQAIARELDRLQQPAG